MKLLKIALAVGFVLLAVYYYFDNYVAGHPLVGTWQSNRELSLKEYYAVGVSAEQEAYLLETLGEKTLRITKNQWMTSLLGENEISSYNVTATDGSCYTVKKLHHPAFVACAQDGLLYVPGIVKGGREVFDKR